jgi:hypothetical protein
MEENKLSGKIELGIYDNGMHMRYIGVISFEFVPIMVHQIATSYSEMGFSDN